MAGSPVQSGATTRVFCSEQKVFGPPSSVSHELQNQRRNGGMEGWRDHPPHHLRHQSACRFARSKALSQKQAGVKKKKPQKNKGEDD